jgi:hypothetical protein
MLFAMTIIYEWRGFVRNEEINKLHAEGFDHAPVEVDWIDVLSRLSLGWVAARDGQASWDSSTWSGMGTHTRSSKTPWWHAGRGGRASGRNSSL